MSQSQSDASKSRARAAQDVEDIDSLKANPAFQRYFERQVIARVSESREAVLHDKKLDREGLWNAREKYFAILDVSTMLLKDEGACKGMLQAEE